MVSTLSSPPKGGLWPDSGLPGPLKPLLGDVSKPFTDAETLVGGEVSTPCEDTGDLMGEGDLGAVSEG